MQHEDLRTDTEKFDDLLADGHTFDAIGYRLGWSMYRVKRHYRGICAELGEQPDEM